MAFRAVRSFSYQQLKSITEASKVLLIDTNPAPGAMVKVQLPRLHRKPAILALDPSASSVKDSLDSFAYMYGTSIELRSSEGDKLASSTATSQLLKEPFLIEHNDQTYCAFPSDFDPTKVVFEPEIRMVAKKYMIERGLSEATASTLANFNHSLLKEIKERESVSTDVFKIAIKKTLATCSLQREYHEDYMQAVATRLKAQYAREIKLLQDIDARAALSANRWLRSFWYVILGQFAFTQYGTYYLYSWDIMEPITCMMTMGDTAAAYYFWILSRGQTYDVGGLRNYFYERKRAKLLKKYKLDPVEMAAMREILEKLGTTLDSTSHS